MVTGPAKCGWMTQSVDKGKTIFKKSIENLKVMMYGTVYRDE